MSADTTGPLDLFVIGGGSGGVRAARMAAQAGARVALAEMRGLGGTCVLRGCVPKKLMVFAAEVPDQIATARAYGWDIELPAHDWPAFHTRLRTELDRLEGVYGRLLDAAGVTVHRARATILDPHTVALGSGERIATRHILIATGGHPVRPGIPGAELGMVSDDVFHLPERPARLLVIGGGYIACEMAFIFAGLGSAVTLATRGHHPLRGFDTEAVGLIEAAAHGRGIALRPGSPPVRIEEVAGGLRATFADGGAVEADRVLFATGRAPNTAGLGLENVEIEPDPFIPVDAFSQTRVPSIYALGDVTDRPQLTPVAIRDAMAFVDTVFRARPTPVSHATVASAVFTDPELGQVGMTEDDAAADPSLGPVDIYATSFRPMRTAFADRPDRTLMKLVVQCATDRVLGCTIVGPGAGEMIQLAAIPVTMQATKADFDRTVAVHPTAAEELVTLRQPARTLHMPDRGTAFA